MKLVYLKESGVGYVGCSECPRIHRVGSNGSLISQRIKVKCECQNVFEVQVEQRQHYRKKVSLVGSFHRIYPENTAKGKIVIEDLSHTGLGFRTITRNELKPEDVIMMRFGLDDVRHSLINEDGIVKIVRDQYVGIEFQHISAHSRKLIGFYLMESAIGEMDNRNEKGMKPRDTLDCSDRQLVWNPFGNPPNAVPADFRGNLRSLSFPHILQALSAQKKTGVLQFAQGRTKRAICFKDGRIIAATGTEGLRLGQILYMRGLISRERLQQALANARKSGKKIGEVLLDMGYVNQDTLQELIGHQTYKVVKDLSLWKEGDFEYRECQVGSDERGIEHMRATDLIPMVQDSPPRKKKREYSRTEVLWPVSMLTPKGPLDGEVRNISLTGALICCRELPDPDEALRLGIEISEFNHTMFATAEMVRFDIQMSDTDLPSYVLGIRFEDISERDLKFLAKQILH